MFELLCTPLVYFLGLLCSFFFHLYKVCFVPIKKKNKSKGNPNSKRFVLGDLGGDLGGVCFLT